jgi:hypothetical protein
MYMEQIHTQSNIQLLLAVEVVAEGRPLTLQVALALAVC